MTDIAYVKWNEDAKNQVLSVIPDKIIREVAQATLELAYPTIPYRTGKMRQSSISGGVRGSNGEYEIGSYTDYANYVYNMPSTTKWTTPGTNAHWFIDYWQKHGQAITAMIITENKIK